MSRQDPWAKVEDLEIELNKLREAFSRSQEEIEFLHFYTYHVQEELEEALLMLDRQTSKLEWARKQIASLKKIAIASHVALSKLLLSQARIIGSCR